MRSGLNRTAPFGGAKVRRLDVSTGRQLAPVVVHRHLDDISDQRRPLLVLPGD
jgi:hypothetical protein